MQYLSGKTALVVGAGAIGTAIATEYGQMGATVFLTKRDGGAAEALAGTLAERLATPDQGSFKGLACDVTSLDSIALLIEALKKNGVGRLDVLVLAAGGNMPSAAVGPDSSFGNLDLAAARAVFESNFFSKAALIQGLLPMLIAAQNASVINIGSMTGLTPLTRVVFYSAAMQAVHSLTRSLAVEFATKSETIYGGAKIRVNAIAPGFFPAEQNRALLQNAEGALTPRGLSIMTHTPMGRFGEVNELWGAALFLAVPELSGFVTGQVLAIDGGFSSMTI